MPNPLIIYPSSFNLVATLTAILSTSLQKFVGSGDSNNITFPSLGLLLMGKSSKLTPLPTYLVIPVLYV